MSKAPYRHLLLSVKQTCSISAELFVKSLLTNKFTKNILGYLGTFRKINVNLI